MAVKMAKQDSLTVCMDKHVSDERIPFPVEMIDNIVNYGLGHIDSLVHGDRGLALPNDHERDIYWRIMDEMKTLLMAMMLEIQDMHIDIKINQRTIGWHGPMSRRADIFKKEYRIYHVIYSLLLGTPLTNIEQEVRVGNEIDLHKVKKIMKLIVKHCILSGKLEDSVWDSALTF